MSVTVIEVVQQDIVVTSTAGSGVVEVLVPGPQGPANTDYQIGGTMPTDPNIKIWYNTNGA
jgi:hypothetical protein